MGRWMGNPASAIRILRQALRPLRCSERYPTSRRLADPELEAGGRSGFEPRRGEPSGRRDGRVVPGYHGPAMSRPARLALACTVILTSVELE